MFLHHLTFSVAHLEKHAMLVSLCLLLPSAGLSERILHINHPPSLLFLFCIWKGYTTRTRLISA